MAPAIIAISIGGILLYSAFKGISVTEVFAGTKGDTLNPHGSSGGNFADYSGGNFSSPGTGLKGGDWKAPAGGAHSFKGPNADLLNKLAGVAQNQFHLTITATTNGGHVADSYHYSGRAFDASGSETDMAAFSMFVKQLYQAQIKELIHNPGFAVKDGKDVTGSIFYAAVWAGHTNHVHVAM